MSETLYERIGGAASVDAAVDVFYRKVLGDSSVSHYFDSTDMDEQRAKQKAFLSWVFGGPEEYKGKDLREAHADLVKNGLNDAHFDAVAGHLAATLNDLGVPEDLAGEVMTLAVSTRDQVLNR